MTEAGRVYEFENVFYNEMNYGTIRLFQIGECCLEIGYDMGTHRQWCYEISCIMSGEGTFFTNGRAYAVKANDLFLNSKYDDHRICADRGSQLRYMYLGFDVPEAECKDPTFLQILRFFDNNPNPCTQDRCGFGELLRKTIQEFCWERVYREEILSTSLRLLVLLAYRNAVTNAPAGGIKTVSGSSVGVTVYSIIRYVDDHIFEIRAIKDLAARLGYSYTYISHLFRNKTGVTLQQYIHQKKMQKAAELMTGMELTVSQAAERLGYQSVQAFSKAFRGVYGESPTAFLRRHGAVENHEYERGYEHETR